MSKLRKNLKKTYSVFIKPSDEIDWKATAKKVTEDVEYFQTLKDIAFPDEDMETVKNKFINNASKMTVYEYYVYKKFNADILVPKSNDVPLLKYVFEDFNLTDLSILFDSVEGLKVLFESIKGKELTNQNSLDVILGLLENKEAKDKVIELIEKVLDAKLIKCIGVDAEVSKQEIIKESIKEFNVQDLKMLFKFIQSSIKYDIEKKKYFGILSRIKMYSSKVHEFDCDKCALAKKMLKNKSELSQEDFLWAKEREYFTQRYCPQGCNKPTILSFSNHIDLNDGIMLNGQPLRLDINPSFILKDDYLNDYYNLCELASNGLFPNAGGALDQDTEFLEMYQIYCAWKNVKKNTSQEVKNE